MEYGYCPYQRNCKFAHGSHELKKNNNLNSKYKTKECGTFCHDAFCRFGDRCNFIHIREVSSSWSSIQVEFREVFYAARAESRRTKLF